MNVPKKICVSITRSQAIIVTNVKKRKGMMPALEASGEIPTQNSINILTPHGNTTRTL
jgi:hypothetical protein